MLPEFSLGGFIAMQIGGVALFVSLAITGFTRLGGLGDMPDHRSAHTVATPTGGGLGIIAGFSAAMLLAVTFHADVIFGLGRLVGPVLSLLTCVFALGMIGLIDDRLIIPTKLKFALILLICLYAALRLGVVMELPFSAGALQLPFALGLAGTVLWLFVVTNAVNFMDGINGLFGGVMALVLITLCLTALAVSATVTALVAGSAAAAIIGFLPYNLRRQAAVFSGDCGSLPIGFLYAGLILLLVREQPDLPLLYLGPLLIMPFLADVLLTLALKPRRGLRLTEAHSTHIFQRAARAFGNPLPVTMLYIGATGTTAIWAQQALIRGTIGSAVGLGGVVVTFMLIYIIASRLLGPID